MRFFFSPERYGISWFYVVSTYGSISFFLRTFYACRSFCHTLKATYTLGDEHALKAGRGWRQLSGRKATYAKIVVHPSVMYSCVGVRTLGKCISDK